MKLQTKYKPIETFSMSSMTDIVFLLLIFFMITASFINSVGLEIELPTSEEAGPVERTLYITITADQTYYIDDQQVPVEKIKSVLKGKLAGKQKAVPILVEADKKVAIDAVVKVIGITKALNAQVSIATKDLSS